jgi:hypothetical protein
MQMNSADIPVYDPDVRVVVLTIGLPASSKTTWSRELVTSDPGRWGGDMFLGFASYVSPEERWYRGADGEWHDLQEELARDLR